MIYQLLVNAGIMKIGASRLRDIDYIKNDWNVEGLSGVTNSLLKGTSLYRQQVRRCHMSANWRLLSPGAALWESLISH